MIHRLRHCPKKIFKYSKGEIARRAAIIRIKVEGKVIKILEIRNEVGNWWK
ncbi:hypothetical protein GCM10011516_32740 [Sphingobacterium cellulitidis]|uniref:Uncharacterized protein n=1 Tax=Sphingobacterium cellulitidis TaxID=1768011 RepID=A0A8H9KX94_9SPHI|nr:hypothetical protein GCM10011516_32740 [Sphingobacterium soli]